MKKVICTLSMKLQDYIDKFWKTRYFLHVQNITIKKLSQFDSKMAGSSE